MRCAVRTRTISYTSLRKRTAELRKHATAGHNEIVFDHGPKEFPVATLLVREPRARALVMAGDLRRWISARWSWLRPRSLPVLVATVGTLAVMLSADFLAHDHGHHLQPHLDNVTIHIAP
jgi:hypothetical protein